MGLPATMPRSVLRWGGAIVLLAALAGCGGGVYVEIPPDDQPPTVGLVGAPTTAQINEIVQFSAIADDDYFVRRVMLYQVIPGGRDALLDTDSTRPYTFNVAIPANTPVASVLEFYAVAEDDVGQTSSSNLVRISVP
jgi:predicted small lipoprotein YifL